VFTAAHSVAFFFLSQVVDLMFNGWRHCDSLSLRRGIVGDQVRVSPDSESGLSAQVMETRLVYSRFGETERSRV
jgi:hypothetical protein